MTDQTVYRNVQEFRIGQLADAAGDAGSSAHQITVHQISDAMEALEINHGDNNYLSLHYTQPEQEVLFSENPSGSLYEDISSDTFGDDLAAASTISASALRVATTTKLSITYNV